MDGDDLKQELLRKSARHREEIEGGVKLITDNTQKILTNALVIGGSLALTYLLVRQLSGSSGKKKHKHKKRSPKVKFVQEAPQEEVVTAVQEEPEEDPGLLGQVGTALMSQASLFLLNLAKDKLMEYLKTMGEEKNEAQPQ